MTEQAAFIGLGIMGRRMVRNLLQAGNSVRVWNRTAARMDEMVEDGTQTGDSAANVATQSNIIYMHERHARCRVSATWSERCYRRVAARLVGD
jgi:3-hydroxyisobutyrate dehydrogenase-like beta-hydroxyacid dehydrogenase